MGERNKIGGAMASDLWNGSEKAHEAARTPGNAGEIELPGQAEIEQALKQLAEPERLQPGLFHDGDDFLGGLAETANAARRERGRPKGATNLRNEQLFDYLEAQGYKNPVVRLLEIVSADPLKMRLPLKEAMALQVRAAEALLPYMLAKKPQAMLVAKQVQHFMIAGDLTAQYGQTVQTEEYQWFSEATPVREGEGVSQASDNGLEKQGVDTIPAAD
jgi:hypothetical protein